jgi:phosphomethylpyrimidine synthase
MKMTQEVRDFTARKELEESVALAAGMREKSAEFVAGGGEIYQGERPAGAKREH